MTSKFRELYGSKNKQRSLGRSTPDLEVAIRPYDPNAKGACHEPLFTLERKLYASQEYLEKHGTPQTVEDLKGHRLIGRFIPPLGDDPFADGRWLLKIGRGLGEPRTDCLDANSLEQEILFAERGKGIIAAYKELSIIRKSGLVNILPDVKQEVPYAFICPDHLKEDPEIIRIKDYLKSAMAALYEGI